jgi:hypothetical protein
VSLKVSDIDSARMVLRVEQGGHQHNPQGDEPVGPAQPDREEERRPQGLSASVMPRPALEVADIFRSHGPAWRTANAGHVSFGQLKAMAAIESSREF